jgi:hypothetical protein
MKLYVVTEPPSIRGIYETWVACESAVAGVRGARYRSVRTRREAQALLSGQALSLAPGVYAFVDGNHFGGVGIVFVMQRTTQPPAIREISTTVEEVFRSAEIPSLSSRHAIREQLARLRNVLAELAALYKALDHVAANTRLTIVHDYSGVGAWMKGRWKINDHVVAEVIDACSKKVNLKSLKVRYQHQHGHQVSDGSNEFAKYNALADQLATKGGLAAGVSG